MTDADWDASIAPRAMLQQLHGKASERKMRLFALACCERIARFITDSRSLDALQFVERHVESTPNRKAGRPVVLQAARRAHAEAYSLFLATSPVTERHRQLILSTAADAACAPLNAYPRWAAEYASAFAAIAAGWEWVIENKPELLPTYSPGYLAVEHRPQCDLLRCVFGNPFRPVAFDPAWLTPTAVSIATGIYHDRAFDRLPILADALEDAGCDSADALAHLRGPGPHARGCWVVDAVLGKA